MEWTTPDIPTPSQIRVAVLSKDKEYIQLLKAINRNDYDEVFDLIINRKVRPKWERLLNTDVSLAAMLGKERILNLLLDNERDPNRWDTTDSVWLRTPIHMAASYGHIECIDILLKRGVDVNTHDGEERTPLHWGSTCGQLETVQFLISRHATVDVAQRDGYTPLQVASCLGHAEICRTLIAHGADVNRTDRDRWTVLHTAVCYGRKDVAGIMLDAGASVHHRTVDLETPFLLACSRGHLGIAEMLYENGSLINEVNKNGDTPFRLAVVNKKYDVARFLINIGADINLPNNAGQTPLYFLALHGEKRMLCIMIEAGCRVPTSVYLPYGAGADAEIDCLYYMSDKPYTLKQLCRLKICTLLGHTIQDDVQTLPIPTFLKDYILLKHLPI